MPDFERRRGFESGGRFTRFPLPARNSSSSSGGKEKPPERPLSLAPTLDQKALEEGRFALEQWQRPESFLAKVEQLAGPIDSERLFNGGVVKFLHDAMVSAEFAKYRPPEKMRLMPKREEWPDGQVGTPNAPVNIEETEVMEEGRKRGDEYRDGKRPEEGSAEDWRERAEAIPALLDTRNSKEDWQWLRKEM